MIKYRAECTIRAQGYPQVHYIKVRLHYIMGSILNHNIKRIQVNRGRVI